MDAAELREGIRADIHEALNGELDINAQYGRALLAVLDATDPEKHGDYTDCACLFCTHERVVAAIAKALDDDA